jgi:hypothetical protein
MSLENMSLEKFSRVGRKLLAPGDTLRSKAAAHGRFWALTHPREPFRPSPVHRRCPEAVSPVPAAGFETTMHCRRARRRDGTELALLTVEEV